MWALALVFVVVIVMIISTVQIDQFLDRREAAKPKPLKTGVSLQDLENFLPSFKAVQENITESFRLVMPIVNRIKVIIKMIG